MERLGVLIDKLKQQHHDNAGKDQLMITLGLIQAELMQTPSYQQQNTKKASVAVIVPAARTISGVVNNHHGNNQQNETKMVDVLDVADKEKHSEPDPVRKNTERKNETGLTHRHMIDEIADPMGEIPTLASHQAYMPASAENPVQQFKKDPVEIHGKGEINGSSTPEGDSLNDRLKETKTELADRLQDTPVKDLKKAIGINDRYLYIIELFSGNEAMYDRSIKTLNSFSILPEAEFWMERELKLKLGWQETNPLVKQFVQLVKRRFS